MTTRSLFLEQLIETEAFIVCSPLETSDFISYCNERGLQISKERLEKFEKLGIFTPIARVQCPKINDVLDNRYANFEWWAQGLPKEWSEEGLLWEPSSRDFQEWKTFEDEEGIEFVKSYYSIFQIHALYHILQSLSLTIPFQAEELEFYPIEDLQPKINNWAKETKSTIKSIKENKPNSIWNFVQQASILCQVISNRFFPKTQTDKRYIEISKSGSYYNWDWNEYCRNWDTNSTIEELGISNDDIKQLHERLIIDAEYIDPLVDWYHLISFISIEKKRKLKDKALLAQSLYAMEYMIRLFYKDLTGEELPAPQTDWGHWHPDNAYGEGVSENYLEYLEFLTNSYHINPKPKLIFVVEGHGEAAEFPRLTQELFGYSFSKYGVEVFNLTGVEGFVGNETIDYKYGALEKFIDYHYSKQTIVYIILDNEGGKGKGASKVRDHLVKRISKINPPYSVIPKDAIHIWDRTTEYDNFSSEEIARAMTEVSGAIYIFSPKEIDETKEKWDKEPRDYLSLLYNDKIGHKLNKTNLMKILFDYIIQNRQNEFDSHGIGNRKIVKRLQEIKKLVSMNHQPGNKKIKKLNQKPVREEK